VSGVGIWFTIGLISPTATSNLIHAYVWDWAIEWVFFIEITAALLYLYKLEPKLHLWYGWIYFLAAYASLVIINGIITFMLTSGRWVDTRPKIRVDPAFLRQPACAASKCQRSLFATIDCATVCAL